MKPIAYLAITTRASGALLYELRSGRAIVWASLGYDSESGRERVRARLRAWNAGRYRIELASSRNAA